MPLIKSTMFRLEHIFELTKLRKSLIFENCIITKQFKIIFLARFSSFLDKN